MNEDPHHLRPDVLPAEVDAFNADLMQRGFQAGVIRDIEPGHLVPPHAHPFEVRALMISGDLTLTVDGAARTYRAGDIFTMPAQCLHQEQFGPQGAKYLVGRR